MLRLVLVGLVAVTGCKEREREPKAASKGSAAVPAVQPAPAAPLPEAYARLIGARRATMGSALASLRLGEAVEAELVPKVPATSFGFLGETEPRVFQRTTDAGPNTLVNLEIRGGKLFAIVAELLTDKGAVPPDQCAGVASALEAKWGAAPDRVWVDRDSHMRVALVDPCKLVFERYVELPQWIGPEPTSVVPVAVVGKPASALASRIGARGKIDENLTYRDVGVGEHASGPTTIDVYVRKGVVSGLGVEAAVPTAERAAIRERISSAFAAKPARDTTTGYDVWATKVPIRMLETHKGVRVEVGNLTQ